MKSFLLTAVLASAALAWAPSSVVAFFGKDGEYAHGADGRPARSTSASYPSESGSPTYGRRVMGDDNGSYGEYNGGYGTDGYSTPGSGDYYGSYGTDGYSTPGSGAADDSADDDCDLESASDCLSNLSCLEEQDGDTPLSCVCVGFAVNCYDNFGCLDSEIVDSCNKEYPTCGNACEGSTSGSPFPRMKSSSDECDIEETTKCVENLWRCDFDYDDEPTCECVEMGMNCYGNNNCVTSDISRACREAFPSCSADECSGTTGGSAGCDSDAFNVCLSTDCVVEFEDGDCDCITTTFACLDRTGCEHDKSANDCAKASPECADQCAAAINSSAAEAVVSVMSVGLAVLAMVL